LKKRPVNEVERIKNARFLQGKTPHTLRHGTYLNGDSEFFAVFVFGGVRQSLVASSLDFCRDQARYPVGVSIDFDSLKIRRDRHSTTRITSYEPAVHMKHRFRLRIDLNPADGSGKRELKNVPRRFGRISDFDPEKSVKIGKGSAGILTGI
jgi:hypothetical protein